MKKLISILAALAVVTTCSAVGFAADFEVPADLETVTKYEKATEGEDAGLYVVPLADVANGQAQTTILAVKGDTISVGSIEYIGQSADTTFKFDLRNELVAGETVYVLAGGSDINASVVGYMALADDSGSELPTTYTISGKVTGYYASTKVAPTVTLTAATSKDAEGNALVYTPAVDIATGTFSQEVVADTYKLVASKPYHTTTTINNLVVAAADVAYAEDLTVYVGNLNSDAAVNARDLTVFRKQFGKTSTNATNWEEISYISMNEDVAINARDLTVLRKNFGKTNVTKTLTMEE